MSLASAALPFPADDPGAALSGFLGSLPARPRLLALGEPMHGEEAFPRLRNEMFRHLVAREGYRSIAVESDCLAALAVDAYVAGGEGSPAEVAATGLSYGFRDAAANHELIAWMRADNAGRDPADRLVFHGFDAPIEMMGAESSRTALLLLHDHLTAHLDPGLVPHSRADIERLAGADGRWSEPAAAMDPARSVGGSAEATALRLTADDLEAVRRAESPALIAAAGPGPWRRAGLYARTAAGLLRYHATMAGTAPTRVSRLLAERDAMMAANLRDIRDGEAGRGPTLVFAHNQHLHRRRSAWDLAGMALTWWSAGAITSAQLGAEYAFLATTMGAAPGQGIAAPAPDTLEGVLAKAGDGPSLYPSRRLAAELGAADLVPRTGSTPDHGYFGLDPADVAGSDGIVFLGDLR